ncbi:MAG: class I SAM-dependent methyltransferase [Actinomycetota bacterium]|nr:class I SAM-dependent methyltransferase [Actinomycetota bacterium]
MSEAVHHPLFARVYQWTSATAEAAGQAEHRRQMLAGLHGRVLELGAGNGLNFEHYPTTVSEVVAVEPEAYLRRRATEAANAAKVDVRVVDGLAGHLPFDEGSFDAAVASLVLCTVPDVEAALADLRRVLRPGGELRFYEHVLAREPRLARFQRAVTRSGAWPLVAGGCHADRDTATALERAGLEIERCRRFRFRPTLLVAPAAPRILGVARRPKEEPL